MSKLYIDTNVIIDAVEGRKNKFKRNIGNPASDLFLQAILCKHYCIISSWTLFELKKKCTVDAIIFFESIKKKIIKVNYDESDEVKARDLYPENFDDALHAVIAEREKADYIITRDRHFNNVKTSIPIKLPEDLI